MKTRGLLCILLCIGVGLQLINAQNNAPIAVNDTIFTIPGYPVSVNVLSNDYDPDGDSIFITYSQLDYEDGILYFPNEYNDYFAVNDNLVRRYYISDDPEGGYNLFDTGYVYIIIDNPFCENLDVNNVSAQFNSFGNHFWEMSGGNGAKYFVPKGSGKTSVFSNSFWMGGLDESEELHVAAELYRQNGIDYWPGPVSEIYDSAYDVKWNRIWKLNKEEIEYHQNHWWEGTYQPIENIATWPGNGNPEHGQSEQIAPYYDHNNDGIYNPFNGDYPRIKGDQALFFVYNDERNVHTESEGIPLGIEVRAMAYAFNQPTDSALWHTTFLHYEIENRSDTTYHETLIGSFTDIDLGNPWDDYVGSNVQGGYYYCYNGKDFDGTGNPNYPDSISYNYGYHPPAQAVMLLGGPLMDEDGIDNPRYNENNQQLCDMSINGLNFGDSVADNERFGMTRFMFFFNSGPNYCSDPQTSFEYYNYLNGIWEDGTSCMYGKFGHVSNGAVGPECNFMFPGDSDTCNWGTNGIPPNGGYNQNGLFWSEEQEGNSSGDRRGLGVSGPFTFEPGDIQELDLAFVWARDYNGDRLSSAELLEEYCTSIREKFVNDPDFFSNINNSIMHKNRLTLFPNPVDNELIIKLPGEITNGNITIFDIRGNRVIDIGMSGDLKFAIDTSQLEGGLYIVKVFDGSLIYTSKFIKK